MLTTKQLEQMNNLEFKEYCEKKYQPFFNHLKNVNANYFFKKKRIIVEFHENSQHKVILSKEKGNFMSALLTEKEINYIEFKAIVFPPNLTIISSKNKPISTQISNYPKTKLSVNLSISNYFIIEDSPNLHYFGKNTKVDSLMAQENYLKNLNNIKIKKTLILSKSKLLKKLPDNLSLAGSLDISNSSIEELGKNTKIKKSLCINESPLREISDLYVGSILLLSNLKNLKKIENTTVKYCCWIFNSNIEKIENNHFLNEFNYNYYGYSDNNKLNKNLSIKNNHIKKIETNSEIFNKIDDIKNIKKIFIQFNSGNNLNILEKLYNQFTNPINHTICFEDYSEYYINKNYINCDAKNDLSTEDFEVYFKNVLLYHADHILKKKLILNQIDKIDDNEIQQYITKNNTSKNIVRVVPSDKKFKFTKGKIPLIYYCQNKNAFKLLYKNNYSFNEQEFNSIKNTFILSDEVKNLYEMYLLRSTYNR